MSARVAVVDEKNRFVRWADRAAVHRDRLDHRSIHVLVFDTAGRLLIQLRHRAKLTFASHWDLSCSGHIEEEDYPAGPDDRLDEVYASCAARELFEELGIRPETTFRGYFAPVPGLHYEQLALYTAASDGPFVIQEDEVCEVRFVTAAELDELARTTPVTGTLVYFAKLAQERGWWKTR